MPEKHVIRSLLNTDGSGSSILLRVSTTDASLLNLTLLATESVGVYSGRVKHSGLTKLKSKANRASYEEWEAILRRLLLLQPLPDDISPTSVQGVEAVASVDEEKSVTVIIRKRVGDITVGNIIRV